MRFTKLQIEKAVSWACEVAAPGVIIEEDTLLAKAGEERPGRGCTYQEHGAFRLELVRLREAVRAGVLDRKGLHLVSRVGVGYQVAKPERVVTHVVKKSYGKIIKEAKRGMNILRKAEIPAHQTKRAADAEMTLGGLHNFAVRQEIDAKGKQEAEEAVVAARSARKKEEVR